MAGSLLLNNCIAIMIIIIITIIIIIITRHNGSHRSVVDDRLCSCDGALTMAACKVYLEARDGSTRVYLHEEKNSGADGEGGRG